MNVNGRRYLRLIMVRFHIISIKANIAQAKAKRKLDFDDLKEDIKYELETISYVTDKVLTCANKKDCYYEPDDNTRKMFDKLNRNTYAISAFRLDQIEKNDYNKWKKNAFIFAHVNNWSDKLRHLIGQYLSEHQVENRRHRKSK